MIGLAFYMDMIKGIEFWNKGQKGFWKKVLRGKEFQMRGNDFLGHALWAKHSGMTVFLEPPLKQNESHSAPCPKLLLLIEGAKILTTILKQERKTFQR